jgi:hypothetical protein
MGHVHPDVNEHTQALLLEWGSLLVLRIHRCEEGIESILSLAMFYTASLVHLVP